MPFFETPRALNRSFSVEWCLETLEDGGLRRVPISPLPFRIGRRPGLNLTLPIASVSKVHAEICQVGTTLTVRDLHSTNGTFVNRQRVDIMPIREGDILHFADMEFRLGRQKEDPGDESQEGHTVALRHIDLPNRLVSGVQEMGELLRRGAVAPVFQPIVSLSDTSLAAYEVLGRGCHPGLPESPSELFQIAAAVGAEAELSRLFVRRAIEMVAHRHDLPRLFLNTHPTELDEPDLLISLAKIVDLAPHLNLVLEIHEGVLADRARIAKLQAQLAEMGIRVAYDDFGMGKGHFLEFADVPPDYLKFDIRFVTGIDRAPPSRLCVLRSFVSAARDLGVETVAEGIETPPEAEVCTDLGFTHAQGFLFGRPTSLDHI